MSTERSRIKVTIGCSLWIRFGAACDASLIKRLDRWEGKIAGNHLSRADGKVKARTWRIRERFGSPAVVHLDRMGNV